MSIIFGFCDESGEYKPIRNARFNTTVPFYVRGTILIEAKDWKELYNRFNYIKRKHKLPDEEIKWSYLWSIRSHQKNKTEIREKKDYYFLRQFDYHQLIEYVDETLAIINLIESAEVILTVTSNDSNCKFGMEHLYEMHIKSLLQRVEYGLNGKTNGFATLFFDPINTKTNEILRNIYKNIYKSGDFVKDYKHIKDSLNIEYSHHSVGIQMADFICGCFIGYLKEYSKSVEIFNNNILPNLRKHKNNILGAGIVEIPTNIEVRNKINNIIDKNNNKC
jgi:hypothetical protein